MYRAPPTRSPPNDNLFKRCRGVMLPEASHQVVRHPAVRAWTMDLTQDVTTGHQRDGFYKKRIVCNGRISWRWPMHAIRRWTNGSDIGVCTRWRWPPTTNDGCVAWLRHKTSVRPNVWPYTTPRCTLDAWSPSDMLSEYEDRPNFIRPLMWTMLVVIIVSIACCSFSKRKRS